MKLKRAKTTEVFLPISSSSSALLAIPGLGSGDGKSRKICKINQCKRDTYSTYYPSQLHLYLCCGPHLLFN